MGATMALRHPALYSFLAAGDVWTLIVLARQLRVDPDAGWFLVYAAIVTALSALLLAGALR